MAVVKQGNRLGLAPGALSAVGVEGFYPIVERAGLGKILHEIILIGDSCDEAVVGISLLGDSSERKQIVHIT